MNRKLNPFLLTASLMMACLAGRIEGQTNGVLREVYTGISGSTLTDLINAPRFPNNPDITEVVTTGFEMPIDVLDNYGQRVRGFVVAPMTGSYVFWISSDDQSALYLSLSDNPAEKQIIANVAGWTSPRQWDVEEGQMSVQIHLIAGNLYYIEAQMKEGGGGDNLAVRWQLPDGTIEEPIPGMSLIPATVPIHPPLVTVQPADATVLESETAVFHIETSNIDSMVYQWFKNNNKINGATNLSYTNLNVSVRDNGARFFCSITNVLGGTNSAEAILTVIPDKIPPTLVNVINTGTRTLLVQFSEPVTLFDNTNNFVLDNRVTISSAVLTADPRVIQLNTSPLALRSTYTLTVNDVVDRSAAANRIAPNTTKSFVTFDYSPQDIGNPILPGSFMPSGDGFNVSAGGTDIGGNVDQFQFTYQERVGNFDYRVQIQSLSLTDPFAKAGLMIRESLSPNSRYAAVLATPGIMGSFFQYRSATGGVSSASGSLPVNYPETWLRLQRLGDVITGYGSFNGADWFQFGTVSMSLTNKYYFGVAVSSHSSTKTTAAEIRSLGSVTGTPGVAKFPADYEPLGPSTRNTPLAISEIMYHPAQRADGKRLEFIEVFNSDPFPLDIGGYRLAGAVEFAFPSGTVLGGGAFVVVAKSPDDLRAVYGLSGVSVLGGFTNQLSNNGETLRLMNNLGAEFLSVTFSGEHPWPAAADGAGHSLVLAHPSYGEGSPKAWSASSVVGGSPGRGDTIVVEPLKAIVINEFLANSGPTNLDYVELSNKSTNTLDLAGCILTDDPSTNKFVLPSGTKIPRNGFLVFTEVQLGFGLNSSGEAVYLFNPTKTRVLDAVRFGATAQDVSSGRYPDGAPNFHELKANTPGKANSLLLIRDIAINEIMYNPISGNSDDQYVELFNRGTNAVDLSGWRFNDGIKFSFPDNTIIAPNGFKVVARNVIHLMDSYTNLNVTNLVGNFSGTLSHGGERISLAMPSEEWVTNSDMSITTNLMHVVVDEVDYQDGGRWGQLSDAGGSSLESIDSHADNRLAANWADSDEIKKSQWTTIEHTGVLDLGDDAFAIDTVQIVMLGEGECLVDDIQVLDASGLNLVPNSTFEGGIAGWELRGSHKHSQLRNEGYRSARSLQVRATSRGDTGPNQLMAPLVKALRPGDVATIRAKVRWLRGATEILFRLHGNHLEAYGRMDIPANLGTPGAQNSRWVKNAGPAIFNVSHNPVLPAVFEPVVVKARLQDPDGIASVQLNYRIDPSISTNTVKMADDGLGADELAGDGIYTATIPGQPNNALIAFSVKATDKAPIPAATSFPNDAPVRECLVHFGETQPTGSFGTYRIWFTQATLDEWSSREQGSNELLDATFAYGRYRAIYNMGAMYSGSPFHWQGYDSPMGRDCNYSLAMPKDDLFLGATDFILNETSNMASDSTAQREQVAHWMAGQLGLPSTYRRYVNVYVNGLHRSFIFEDAQQPSGDFVEAWFPNDSSGDLHKIEDWFEFDSTYLTSFNNYDGTLENFVTTDGTKKLARYRWTWRKRAVQGSENDYTNLFALVDAVNTVNTNAYTPAVESLVDVEQWMRTMALRHAVGDWDAYGYRRGKNMYAYKPDNGLWQLLNWDIAFSFGLGDGTTADLFSVAHFDGMPDPITDRMFKNPPFRRVYLRAFQDILNGPFADTNVNPVMDAKYAALNANLVSATTPAPIKSYIASRRAFIQRVLSTNNAPFAVASGDGGSITINNNLLLLEGTAPVGVASIRINGIVYPPRWLTLTNWQIKLPVKAGANALAVAGYDSYGKPIDGAAVSVNVQFNGPLELPENKIVINEIMYHPDVPNASYVEIFNSSVLEAFDLSRCQIRGLDFTFPDGSIILPQGFLVVAKDLLVFQKTYGADIPVAGLFNGQLQNGGETLTLVKPGASTDTDLVLSRVRYDSAAPWPASADGFGASLQLIDPAQDDSRLANWAAVGTNGLALPRWQYAAVTGVPSGSRLTLKLNGGGQVYLDNLSLVAGVVPTVGLNLLANGGFESPIAGSWTVAGDYTNSVADPGYAHRGAYALKLSAIPAGSNAVSGEFSQIIASGLVQGQSYTLSYWFLPSEAGADLTIRLEGDWTPGSQELINHNLAKLDTVALRTPGRPNSVRATLPAIPSVWINEVQPENIGAILDNAGQKDPWIELFNSGASDANLDGFYLTDSYTNLTAWALPANTVIHSGQFLLVWADGQIEQTTASELHAGFSMASTGSIALARRQNGQIAVVDYLDYSGIAGGMAYGLRVDGDKQNLGILAYATPGTSNSVANVPIKVRINEWMADNTKILADPQDGSFNDWFELYNASETPVDLSGYILTDSPTNLAKSIVPQGVRIEARGFLLVWADGKTKFGDNGDMHANFKLSKAGDFIGLYTPDKRLVDAVSFGAQTSDISQGRYPDGQAEPFVFFPAPSPRASNPNPAGGVAPRIVEIRFTTEGVAIKVTTELGKTYRLQYSDSLLSSGWQNLGDSVIASLEQTVFTDASAVGKTERFYRIVKAPNP
jgi:hypothetical protein